MTGKKDTTLPYGTRLGGSIRPVPDCAETAKLRSNLMLRLFLNSLKKLRLWILLQWYIGRNRRVELKCFLPQQMLRCLGA